ncbi:hypothetical protein BH23BAC1_BH23BAC1_28600 [soil metagenome]
MKLNYQKIYEKLGYLFYAIAAADKNVKPAEIEKLREIVVKDWLPMEDSKDEFDTDAAHYILFAFDYLHAEGVQSKEAFQTFVEYIKDHRNVIKDSFKAKIYNSAHVLANAFSGTNKAESSYLKQLEFVLK